MKININKENVGLRIKNIRLKKGYELQQFGDLLGAYRANKSSVFGWENGRSLPNKERIKAIAKIGDITVNELLYGSVEEFIRENYMHITGIGSHLIEKHGVNHFLNFFENHKKDNHIELITNKYNINNIDTLLQNLSSLTEVYLYSEFFDISTEIVHKETSNISEEDITPTENYKNKKEYVEYLINKNFDLMLERFKESSIINIASSENNKSNDSDTPKFISGFIDGFNIGFNKTKNSKALKTTEQFTTLITAINSMNAENQKQIVEQVLKSIPADKLESDDIKALASDFEIDISKL